MSNKLILCFLIALLFCFSGCRCNNAKQVVDEAKDMPDPIYQIICDATERTGTHAVKNHENDPVFNHKYAGYEFTEADALNWLKQTRGKINFVLTVRDLEFIEPERVVAESAAGQKRILHSFRSAYETLKQLEPEFKISMPYFFIGTPEEVPPTLGIAVYEEIMKDNTISKDWIKGIYFAGEGPASNADHMVTVADFIHSQGKELLWIPYLNNKADFVEIANRADRGLADVIIVQIGYFYREFDEIKEGEKELLLRQREASVYQSIKAKRFLWVENPDQWDQTEAVGKTENLHIGVQFEVDNSILAGRRIKSTSTPEEKVGYFNRSLTVFRPFIGTEIVGFYTGGPNEQGYNDCNINQNLHSTLGFEAYDYDPLTNFHGSGTPYHQFGVLYDGNLIYDIFQELVVNRSDFHLSFQDNRITIVK